MGGHGIFIWPAYLIAAAVLIGILTHSIISLRQRERQLETLRRERRGAADEDET